MPSRQRLRPLKAWRYVGVYGPELMLCIGSVRIGPARQAFWAVWDRSSRRLHERTVLGRGAVTLEPGRARVTDRAIQIDLSLAETSGIETVSAAATVTRGRASKVGSSVRGTVAIDGQPRCSRRTAVIDDTAAYYPRHTSWRWSAGVGVAGDGRGVAWNLVAGVNDRPHDSERTVWIDGRAGRGRPERVRRRSLGRRRAGVRRPRRCAQSDENLLLIRSPYRQPFGTFSGCCRRVGARRGLRRDGGARRPLVIVSLDVVVGYPRQHQPRRRI